MQRYRLYSLVLLLCSAHALFGCEPWISVLDTTYGNAAQVNPGGQGSISQLPAGISLLFPVVDQVISVKGIYDDTTQRIISISTANNPTRASAFMVTDTVGIITATTITQIDEVNVKLRDIALLTASTSVVAAGNMSEVEGAPTVCCFDQQGTLLWSNTQAFADVLDAKPMNAVEVVSSSSLVIAGQVDQQFALAFYNYSGVLTKTALTVFNKTAEVAVLAQLADTSIIAGGHAGEDLALAKYTLDGNLTSSVAYQAAAILPNSLGAAITALVTLTTGEILIGGTIENPSTSLINPFLARVDENLENFTVLQVMTELSTSNELLQSSLADTGDGYVIMTVPGVSLSEPTTVIKLAYDGTYDTTFGSCRGSQVLPNANVCVIAESSAELCQTMVSVGANSLAFVDGEIIIFGALWGIVGLEGVVLAGSFKITGASTPPVTLSTDPLTAAIQRKYFGINV